MVGKYSDKINSVIQKAISDELDSFLTNIKRVAEIEFVREIRDAEHHIETDIKKSVESIEEFDLWRSKRTAIIDIKEEVDLKFKEFLSDYFNDKILSLRFFDNVNLSATRIKLRLPKMDTKHNGGNDAA